MDVSHTVAATLFLNNQTLIQGFVVVSTFRHRVNAADARGMFSNPLPSIEFAALHCSAG